MLEIAFIIAIFSYSIYFLGLLGLLYKPLVVLITVLFWLCVIVLKKYSLFVYFERIKNFQYTPVITISLIYITVQALINSIGLYGPEIGFDATWYHLTFPKWYLLFHNITYFPGGPFYYSAMPKLTEMLFTSGLAFGSDFYARAVEFIFGILACIVIYKIGRRFFSAEWAMLLPVIFYSNLVVGWESFSGYIDLSRAFFAGCTLLAFLIYLDTKDKKYFILFSLLAGLTIATKLLALPDIGIYAVALIILEKDKTILNRIKQVFSFLLLALIPLLPWFIFSFINTGNPIFPMLSSTYKIEGYWQIFNPLFLVKNIWDTFGNSSDPVHPIFLAMLPFYIIFFKKLWKEIPAIVTISVGGIVAWYITPNTGGGRYVLAYLIPISVMSVYIISHLQKNWQRIFVVFIASVAVISIIYRGIAVAKFIPVITGQESKAYFMSARLQFNLGDFYDTDGYFASHIKPTDKVLIYNFHNLYYVDFPFVYSSWTRSGDTFDYVVLQGGGLPKEYTYWHLVYFNPLTQVSVYSKKS